MKSFISKLLDLVYPPRCPFCRKLLESKEGAICAECDRKLPRTNEFTGVQKLSGVDICCTPLYYRDMVRSSLLRYKFSGAAAYCEIYAKLTAKSIDESGITCDTITWVPVSRRRYMERGYDQAQLLAEAIARRMGVPCVRLLKKRRHNKAQSRSGSSAQRKKNVSGIFVPVNADRISGKRILVIDDIVTSGSTLSECADVLLKAGARSISAAAVARSK